MILYKSDKLGLIAYLMVNAGIERRNKGKASISLMAAFKLRDL